MKIKVLIREEQYSENTTQSFARIKEVEIPEEEMERLYQEFLKKFREDMKHMIVV